MKHAYKHFVSTRNMFASTVFIIHFSTALFINYADLIKGEYNKPLKFVT